MGNSLLNLLDNDITHIARFISWTFVRREGNRVAHELAHVVSWVFLV